MASPFDKFTRHTSRQLSLQLPNLFFNPQRIPGNEDQEALSNPDQSSAVPKERVRKAPRDYMDLSSGALSQNWRIIKSPSRLWRSDPGLAVRFPVEQLRQQ